MIVIQKQLKACLQFCRDEANSGSFRITGKRITGKTLDDGNAKNVEIGVNYKIPKIRGISRALQKLF